MPYPFALRKLHRGLDTAARAKSLYLIRRGLRARLFSAAAEATRVTDGE